MKIISISGLDGSGKSTQIKLLQNYLESQDKRVFYFHAINFGIAKKIINKKRAVSPRPYFNSTIEDDEKSVTKSGWFKIQLRKIALCIDLQRFKKLIAKLEKQGYDYLISDRYFYDSLINIEYLSGKLNMQCYEIIKPDLAIYLQTSPETIMQRERIPDQGLEYLQNKKEIYDKYAGVWNLKIVDGNRNKEEIFEEIRIHVK